jgi:AcrR family transcriptional regulator
MNIKDKIAETAFLLSLKSGFDNVSIKKISDESGVSIGGIYYHFTDKTEILKYIIRKFFSVEIVLFNKIIKNKEDSLIEKLRYLLYNHEKMLKDENNIIGFSKPDELDFNEYFLLLASVYHQYPEVRDEYDESILGVFNFFKKLVEISIAKKEIKEDINPHDVAINILTAYLGISLIAAEFSYVSFAELVEKNLEMIWNNIKVE